MTTRRVGPAGEVLPPGHPGVVDVTFEVEANRGSRSISSMIYGINHGSELPPLHWGAVRSGGNRLTAYNWENNASNAGSDFMFQNDGFLEASDAPAKALLRTIDAAIGVTAASIITISNADHVAADKNGGGDVRSSGAHYLSTRFKRNLPKKPTPFAAVPDVSDDVVYQDELVAFLHAERPHARVLFSMDNEPELWSHTHAEIFPKPVTYADLWRRNHDFSLAVKQAWPSAEVLGFVSYGYLGYKTLQDASDADGRDFIDWYLEQARAAEKVEGKRLIDYLDLHWYPEALGAGTRIVGDETEPDVVAAREQAPRSLWDPSYEEKSWIRDSVGGPIELLPRLQAKINEHYPGTKLAFTEWNFGGGKHISGALAVADVLGTFGRLGVGLATYWPLTANETFAVAAFRAYRNYDGQGSAFGDTSIAASSSNVAVATVYASLDSADPKRVIVVAINKANIRKLAGVKITHSSVYPRAATFVLSGASDRLTPGMTLTATATNAFQYSMPPQSVSVIVPQL